MIRNFSSGYHSRNGGGDSFKTERSLPLVERLFNRVPGSRTRARLDPIDLRTRRIDCMFNQLRGTTAPLPADEVAAAYAPFGESRMLPRRAYVDPAVHDWEQANIFAGWMCLGRGEKFAEAGAQTSVETGAGGVLLVRGEDGTLRAFANVCRHRGHELVPCGVSVNKRSIVCPYHGWNYKLDGSLRNAPGGFRDVEDFDKSQFGLAELNVVEWHGWVFVDPSGEGGPFVEHAAGLEQVVANYRPEDLVTVASHSYELETNWKIIVENYQECYHCPSIHPELCRVSPPQSGENLDPDGEWMGGWMDLMPDADHHVPRRQQRRRRDPRADRRRDAHGDVRRGVPQPAHQPAPRLRDDPHAAPALRGPHVRRVLVGLPPRGGRAARLRPVVRRGLLGPHQPPGLGGLRVGAAWPHQPARASPARWPPRRTASTSSSATWVARTPASAAPTTPARR